MDILGMTSSQEIETIKAIVYMTALFIFLIVILAIVLFVTSRRNKSRGDSLRGLAQKMGVNGKFSHRLCRFVCLYNVLRNTVSTGGNFFPIHQSRNLPGYMK